ncbi:MAG: ketopantoate reductase C-terminal domain-containing protein, partial [Pseudomonadota bacterium]
WSKFILFCAGSGVTAGARCRMGSVQATPALWSVYEALVDEGLAVAKAKGIPLPETTRQRLLEVGRGFPVEARTSTAHDLEDGKSLEIDWTLGALLREGAALDVPTPTAQALYGILAPWKDGTP